MFAHIKLQYDIKGNMVLYSINKIFEGTLWRSLKSRPILCDILAAM